MYYDDFDPFHNETEREVYENDLQEFSDREAFEDMIAERDDLYGREDDFLEAAYEDRTDLEHMEDFGEY
jgi:hypothetical protein